MEISPTATDRGRSNESAEPVDIHGGRGESSDTPYDREPMSVL